MKQTNGRNSYTYVERNDQSLSDVAYIYHLCPGLTKPVNGRLVVPINLV